MKRIIREAPAIDEIYITERGWSISLVMVQKHSKIVGLSLADVTVEEDMVILAIDRAGATLTKPNSTEQIMEGDRLLVYGNNQSVKRILS